MNDKKRVHVKRGGLDWEIREDGNANASIMYFRFEVWKWEWQDWWWLRVGSEASAIDTTHETRNIAMDEAIPQLRTHLQAVLENLPQ